MARRFIVVIFGLALLATLFSSTGAITQVAAQSQTGGVFSFESGVDGAEIGATLAGLRFSNSEGFPWRYGDVRTGLYNAPYPEECPGFGGPCAYTVNGNFFAWMGPVAGVGRIDFTDGSVTFFSASFSTADPLSIEAYNAAGQQVGVQNVSPNLRTGRLDRVSFSASGIAYLLIRGADNRWLMDDLTTEEPQSPPRGANAKPAQVTVVQRVQAPATISPGSSLTLTVVATNRGRGVAKNIIATLPLDAARIRVDEASFSRQGAWVSQLAADKLEIQTGALGGGEVVTVTLRLTVLAAAAAGGDIGPAMTFKWLDGAGGGNSKSNRLAMSVGGPAPTPQLSGSLADGKYSFSSAIFAPGEPVAVWYNTAAGAAIALKGVVADSEGSIAFSLATGELAAGASLVVYGAWTEFTAVTPLSLP